MRCKLKCSGVINLAHLFFSSRTSLEYPRRDRSTKHQSLHVQRMLKDRSPTRNAVDSMERMIPAFHCPIHTLHRDMVQVGERKVAKIAPEATLYSYPEACTMRSLILSRRGARAWNAWWTLAH